MHNGRVGAPYGQRYSAGGNDGGARPYGGERNPSGICMRFLRYHEFEFRATGPI